MGLRAGSRSARAGGCGEVAGVDDEGEVGAGVDRCLDLRVGWAGRIEVRVGGQGGGEVGSGGEAEDADAIGVDVPVGGVCAGDAHGLLGVFEVFGVGGVVAGLRDAVLDEHARDADGVEPGADLRTFEVVGEDGVASAGKDEDGGAMGLAVAG